MSVATASVCSHSIGARLSRKVALFTMVVIGLLSAACWFSVAMLIKQRNVQDTLLRVEQMDRVLDREAASGGLASVLERLHSDAPMRANVRVELFDLDGGAAVYRHAGGAYDGASEHQRTEVFAVEAGGRLRWRATYTIDYSREAAMGRRWAWILIVVTLAAGGIVAGGAQWHVKRALRPLRGLATQTRAISPQSLHQRLELSDPAEELKPWIEQFNALMERLERAYTQLEGFNADVAHELRTPLATLIGQTEVALSRERSNEVLRETLVSNLEEMQRLSAMVNDMLFLSQADRGAVARRGEPVSLATLAAQVIEFHEAPLEEAGLALRIEGDATVPVDEPLFKRALSNLLGNATRYADRGSTVIVRIAGEPAAGPVGVVEGLPEQVQVVVQNQGRPIAEQQLPRLFDRFFRGEECRSCPEEQHHGLGLAIVAAIARMHAGRTLAEHSAGLTRVGFTLATR